MNSGRVVHSFTNLANSSSWGCAATKPAATTANAITRATFMLFSISAPRYRNRDVAVLHPARVIALDIDRPGFALIRVQGAAGDSRNLLVVDRGDAVANHRHHASHQRNVEALPCARLARHFSRRSDEPVNRPHPVEFIVEAQRFILHLD